MMWRRAKITAQRKSWGTAVEYDAVLEDGREVRALAYTAQVGKPHVGEDVLVSAAAVERGLGTGGYMMVIAIPQRLPADPPPQPGHIMKARYTPMQFMVQGVDEQESQHHEILKNADSIEGMPVVVSDIHSALPAIVAGIHQVAPRARIAYIMTDGAALPAWFSQVAFTLREQGNILGTITAGQAYGGDLEAINIYTALLAAKLVWKADVSIVSQGPGNAGTGTMWGFSGTQAGEAINAVDTLDGQALACLRMSSADERDRHRGISHHTIRILTDVVRAKCILPAPLIDPNDAVSSLVPIDVVSKVDEQLTQLNDHPDFVVDLISTSEMTDILDNAPAPLRTMGRGLREDPLSFLAAACAGVSAGTRISPKNDDVTFEK